MDRTGPRWDHLKSLLFVIRTGSFSAAARALGLKQSTISRQIDALEEELGIVLFTRSPKGLRPTDGALRLVPHLETLGNVTELFLRDAESDTTEISGTVRLTTNEPLAIEVLPKVLSHVSVKLPALRFEVSISDRAEDLLSREADIAIRASRSVQKAILTKKVGELEMGLFASRSYLKNRKKPETLADLEGHRMIGWDVTSERANRIMNLKNTLLSDKTSLASDSSALQIQLVDAGNGIGLWLANKARTERIRLLADEVSYRSPVWCAMHEDLKSNKKYKAAFNELASAFTAALANLT
jgi:DNA-binding transcriptional LysR family regulator